MIDFHSHILPAIDDGSKSTDMSLAMLRESLRQGVELCIATPHFYGSRSRIEAFLEKRRCAWRELQAAMAQSGEDFPDILVGAEVAYYAGMSGTEQLDKLCIGRSCLLLELPVGPWDDTVLRDVETLTERYHLMLAHCERYFVSRENELMLHEMAKLPLTIQINAHSIERFFLRTKILSFFPEGFVLGSDMHNMDSRPQNLARGRAMLKPKKLAQIDALEKALLQELTEEQTAAEPIKRRAPYEMRHSAAYRGIRHRNLTDERQAITNKGGTPL